MLQYYGLTKVDRMLKRVFKGQERKYINVSYGNLTIKSLADY